MASKKIIEPRILKGTRDFLPEQMVKRNFVCDQITKIFECFGYSPIETPILSYAEILLGKYGEEGDRLTYNFEDAGGRHVALPYDLTVPMARFVAAHAHELPMPFKRYQIQRVWRAEKPQKGRLREFYQCDIDIMGTTDLMADVEIAKVVVEVLKTLGFDDTVVKVNSRRLMNNVLKSLGLKDQVVEVIRSIDKMDKIGREGVTSELIEKVGLESSTVDRLFEIFENKAFDEFDTSEIDGFMERAKAFGITEEELQFDPYLARGLDYYTGMIFEAISPSAGVGSLAGGGRYDNLCGSFTKQEISGVGVAFGFERLMIVLEEQGRLENLELSTKVLLARFDETDYPDVLKRYNQLIKSGISTEMYFEATKLGKQFKYADRKGIPLVVLQGPEEKQAGKVMVKNMKSGEQHELSESEFVESILKTLD